MTKVLLAGLESPQAVCCGSVIRNLPPQPRPAQIRKDKPCTDSSKSQGGGSESRILSGALLIAFMLLASVTRCHATQSGSCPTEPTNPTITSITPSYWQAGQTFTVTITGTNFSPTCMDAAGIIWAQTALLIGPAGLSDASVETIPLPTLSTLVQPGVTYISPTQMTASITTLPTDTSGPVCIIATQDALTILFLAEKGMNATVHTNAVEPGSYPNLCSSKIKAAQQTYTAYVVPTATAITPKALWAGQSTVVTITGTGFTPQNMSAATSPATTLTASVPNGSVTILSYTVDSPTQITATVELGKDAPAEKVTYTITNPVPSGTISEVTTQVGTIGPIATITENTLPIPLIYQNGQQVTDYNGKSNGSNALNVVVGQPIILTTQLTAPIDGVYPFTSTTWTANGTLIKKLESTSTTLTVTPIVAADMAHPSLNFFWSNPGTSPSPSYPVTVPVTYQYCVSAPVTNPCSIVVTADFVVNGPKGVNVKICFGNVTTPACTSSNDLAIVTVVHPHPTTDFLEIGNAYAAFTNPAITDDLFNRGIVFQAIADDSTPYGTYEFAQTIQDLDIEYNYDNNLGTGGNPCTITGSGLDTVFPYAIAMQQSDTPDASDSPGTPLYQDDTEVTETMQASMYLLWSADGVSGANPISLGYVNWQWFGDAVQNSSGWETNPITTSHGTAQSFEASSEYPTWSNVLIAPVNQYSDDLSVNYSPCLR